MRVANELRKIVFFKKFCGNGEKWNVCWTGYKVEGQTFF